MTTDPSRGGDGGGGAAGVESPGGGRAPGALRVLVIDDDEPVRVALRRYFTRLGWRTDDLPDGATALAVLLGEPPADYDAILSDLRMPGLSGVELHDRLATQRPALLPRLIFSTGDAVSQDVADFVGRTSCLVIEKPFDLARLRETILRVAQGGG